MSVIRQIVRGCTSLPHVGHHPGTAVMLIFALMGALSGWDSGPYGVVFGAGFMMVCTAPFYLCGAYDRARLSDAIERKESSK